VGQKSGRLGSAVGTAVGMDGAIAVSAGHSQHRPPRRCGDGGDAGRSAQYRATALNMFGPGQIRAWPIHKIRVDTDRSFGLWDSCSRADLEIRVVTAVSGARRCLAADYGRTARNLSEQSSAPLKASSPGHRLRRISALTPSPMAEFRAPLSNLQPLSRLPTSATY
jgi:hypothetical protein